MFKTIIDYCDKHGTTVTAMERELGFGRGTISKWKNSSPSIDKVKAVADYMGCSIDDLVSEEKKTGQGEGDIDACKHNVFVQRGKRRVQKNKLL